jgi:hypothetical protein
VEYGTKTRLRFVFDVSTTKQLKRIAAHTGRSVTSLIKEWAASAERRIVGQLSAREEKRCYDENDASSSMSIVISHNQSNGVQQ